METQGTEKKHTGFLEIGIPSILLYSFVKASHKTRLHSSSMEQILLLEGNSFRIVNPVDKGRNKELWSFLHSLRGPSPQNPELSSGGQVPCTTGFPHYVGVLGSHLYQCTSWHCCERLHSDSVDFFKRVFQRICPFHDGWFTSTPAYTTLGVQQFLAHAKQQDQHASLPYSYNLTLSDFFVPPMKKVLKMRCFADVEKVKWENGSSTRRHQNWYV